MNPKYHLLVAVAALSLGGCSTDDTCTDPEIGGHKISFTVAEDSETRTTLETLDKRDFLRWVSTDQVGIYTVGQCVNYNTVTTADVNQSPVEFVGTLNQPVSSGDMFYAYYPYNDAQTTDPTAVKLSIPAKQKQTKAGVYNGESHPLVALPMEFQWEQGSDACHLSSVRFRQLGAIVELQLFSSDETLRSEKIRSVTFESDTPLAGDFSFDLTGVTIDEKEKLAISGYESKEVTTSLEETAAIPATKDEVARIYLTIAPGTYTGQIVVETNAAQYAFRLTKALTFERAAIMGLPADLAEAKRSEIDIDAPIHFADAEAKRICVENWDTNGDGELSYKEAAAVTSLGSKFDSKGSINSFNELQYFTGLQSIEDYAFYDCSSLTSIHLPEGLIAVGDSAFSHCSSLTSINIPQTISSISAYAFRRCSSLSSFEGKYASADHRCLIQDGTLLAFAPADLTEYTIPAGVTAIGTATFFECSSLTSITIPEGVTAIGDSAFSVCSSLTSITIPEGVTEIGNYAFNGCSSLTSINIPAGVTAIGESAFSRCSSLTSINIPEGVTTISKQAFSGCSSLTSITIPAGVTAIGDSAFFNCSSLTSIHIPDGVTAIGNSAFQWCSSLTSIHLPDGVTSIGESAFRNCSSLKSINIPQTVSSIGKVPFGGCSSLSAFEGKYASADHRCLIQNGTLLAFASASLTGYTIPAGVTAIGAAAFMGCSSLTSINIPEGVTSIGDSAFSRCSSLTSINIPEGVTSIEWYAFANCSSLTSVHIPDGVATIGTATFSNCSSLTSLYCKSITPPTSDGNPFISTPSSMKIYVPAASVEAYKTTEFWSWYASQIFADNN